jgi:hypothetical protein
LRHSAGVIGRSGPWRRRRSEQILLRTASATSSGGAHSIKSGFFVLRLEHISSAVIKEGAMQNGPKTVMSTRQPKPAGSLAARPKGGTGLTHELFKRARKGYQPTRRCPKGQGRLTSSRQRSLREVQQSTGQFLEVTGSPYHSTANRCPRRFQRRRWSWSSGGSGTAGFRFFVSRSPSARL